MSKTFADKIIEFNQSLSFDLRLPEGFQVMNPFLDNPETMSVMKEFYTKFYNDSNPRKFIIGINPSRKGAGVTGVPFTDTKRLLSDCGIEMKSAHTHEISSVFMYEMIRDYCGVDAFYHQYYINSPFPLAIIRMNKNKQWVNANYYDDVKLFNALKSYMIGSLKKQIELGLLTEEVYVLGKKNAHFLDKINREEKLFGRLQVLEHPRYIQQYKSKEKKAYIDKYIRVLEGDLDSFYGLT